MTPTPAQLRLLKLIVAGVRLHAPAETSKKCQLLLNGVEIATTQQRLVAPMIAAKWLALDPVSRVYQLTPAGRAQTEVGTFVRHFAESQ